MAAAAEVSVGTALGGVGGGVDIARRAGSDAAGAAETNPAGTGNPGAGTGAEGIVIPPHQPQYEADHRKEESEYTETDGFGVIRRGVPLVCIRIVSALRRRLSAVLSRIAADGLSLPRLIFIESEQIAAVLRLTFTCLPLQRCAAVAAKFGVVVHLFSAIMTIHTYPLFDEVSSQRYYII